VKRRLLVVRLSALGDVVHTIPAVMTLREEFDVSWIVERPYAELVQIVAGVEPVPVRLKRWSLNRILDARNAVRDDFDVAIDFQGLIKSALVTWSSDARERYGFAKEFAREKQSAWLYNHKVAIDPKQHVVDWNRQLAAAVTGRAVARDTDADWDSFARDPLGRLEPLENKIVLLPGAGRPEKQWPVERFREVVQRYGNDAVVVWGPGERDLAAAIGGVIAPETNLRELTYVLRNARVVVGGDTGPLHLAAAVGTRVVGLYGPTDPARNGPYGQLDRTIRRDSMDAIAAGDVMNMIEEVVPG
jgi:heptosyltransferase-1